MPQLLANAIVTSAIYVLVGLSFSLIYTTSRFFNFAHAGYIVVAPYVAYFLARNLGAGWLLAFVTGAIAGALTAIALDAFIFQLLVGRQSPSTAPLLASLGLFVVIQATIALVFGAASLSFGLGEGSIYEVLGARLTGVQGATIIAAIVGAAMVWLFLQRSTRGKLIRAVGCDRELAIAYGIDPVKVSLMATGVGAAMAGIVGCLSAADIGLTPTAGFQLLLGGVVAMVIGGVGSTPGLLLGAILVAAVEHGAQWWFSSAWDRLILFGILLLFLLFRPAGILGRSSRAASV